MPLIDPVSQVAAYLLALAIRSSIDRTLLVIRITRSISGWAFSMRRGRFSMNCNTSAWMIGALARMIAPNSVMKTIKTINAASQRGTPICSSRRAGGSSR